MNSFYNKLFFLFLGLAGFSGYLYGYVSNLNLLTNNDHKRTICILSDIHDSRPDDPYLFAEVLELAGELHRRGRKVVFLLEDRFGQKKESYSGIDFFCFNDFIKDEHSKKDYIELVFDYRRAFLQGSFSGLDLLDFFSAGRRFLTRYSEVRNIDNRNFPLYWAKWFSDDDVFQLLSKKELNEMFYDVFLKFLESSTNGFIRYIRSFFKYEAALCKTSPISSHIRDRFYFLTDQLSGLINMALTNYKSLGPNYYDFFKAALSYESTQKSKNVDVSKQYCPFTDYFYEYDKSTGQLDLYTAFEVGDLPHCCSANFGENYIFKGRASEENSVKEGFYCDLSSWSLDLTLFFELFKDLNSDLSNGLETVYFVVAGENHAEAVSSVLKNVFQYQELDVDKGFLSQATNNQEPSREQEGGASDAYFTYANMNRALSGNEIFSSEKLDTITSIFDKLFDENEFSEEIFNNEIKDFLLDLEVGDFSKCLILRKLLNKSFEDNSFFAEYISSFLNDPYNDLFVKVILISKVLFRQSENTSSIQACVEPCYHFLKNSLPNSFIYFLFNGRVLKSIKTNFDKSEFLKIHINGILDRYNNAYDYFVASGEEIFNFFPSFPIFPQLVDDYSVVDFLSDCFYYYHMSYIDCMEDGEEKTDLKRRLDDFLYIKKFDREAVRRAVNKFALKSETSFDFLPMPRLIIWPDQTYIVQPRKRSVFETSHEDCQSNLTEKHKRLL